MTFWIMTFYDILSYGIQTVDKPKDWYKSMFKAMHKAGRSGYVGDTDVETDMEGGKSRKITINRSLTYKEFYF